MKQAEIVARDIVGQIVRENMVEGTKLPNERSMQETYQVGRSTLREALRLLESRGVLTIRSGRDGGPTVRRPRASDLGETLTLLMQFGGYPRSEVYGARQALEPVLARMAAENADDELIVILQASTERMAADLEDRDIFRAENLLYHESVAHASQSPLLEMFCSALESVSGGMAFGLVDADFTPEQRAIAVQGHRNITKALAKHDPDAAAEAMGAHLEDGMVNFREAYQGLASQPVQWSFPTATGPLSLH